MFLAYGVWGIGLVAVGVLTYTIGYRRGFRDGKKRGFVHGLERSIAVQKPTDVLCRTLVPRPLAEYGRYFASLLR